MKFPRNAKIFRGQLDATPFAGVFFCVLLLLLLRSLLYTPGVLIHLPASTAKITGVDGPTVAVAVDAANQFYFENHIVRTNELLNRLAQQVRNSPQPITLVVEADRSVTLETLDLLSDIATAAGITQVLQQSLPRTFDPPAGKR